MTACPGCGVTLPDDPAGASHPYIGASSGCWARFGELQALVYAEALGHLVLRHLGDAYAASHPGTDGRQERQSVGLHLVALCHWLEHGIDDVTPITQRLLAGRRDWPWLAPPDPSSYAMTVVDVLDAVPRDGAAAVRGWAEAVWAAWGAHHATVRAWAAETLAR